MCYLTSGLFTNNEMEGCINHRVRGALAAVLCGGGLTILVDRLSHCNGEPKDLQNKGNEFDWLRFWWDLHTDLDASVADIFLIWADANPHNWDSSQVFARLRQHAPSHGISTGNFEAWGATNGNNHGVWP
jgi:hypothetical protein